MFSLEIAVISSLIKKEKHNKFFHYGNSNIAQKDWNNT